MNAQRAEGHLESHEDHYALDDTLAGRIAQAAAVGIVTSYPDWIKNPTVRAAVTVASGLGFAALVAVTNAYAEEQELSDADLVSTSDTADTADTADTGAGDDAVELEPWHIALGVAALGAGLAVDVVVSRKIAGALRKRGIAKPWTLLGAVGAAAVFVVSEAEARDIARRVEAAEQAQPR